MKQSRIDSLMEVLTNTVIGLAVSQAANYYILPAIIGVAVSMGQAFIVGLAFTVVSAARSYVLRRAFDGKTPWLGIKTWFARKALCDCRACTSGIYYP